MTDWYEKAFKTLQLAGYAETSQQGYLRAIRMLVDHTGKTQDLVGEEELQDYFLHRKNVDHWAPATMRICYSSLRFFSPKCCGGNGAPSTTWGPSGK